MPGKPLQQLVTTHHHFDHTAGLRAAIAEGLTVITHSGNSAWVEAMAQAAAHASSPTRWRRTHSRLIVETVDAEREFKDQTDDRDAVSRRRQSAFRHDADGLHPARTRARRGRRVQPGLGGESLRRQPAREHQEAQTARRSHRAAARRHCTDDGIRESRRAKASCKLSACSAILVVSSATADAQETQKPFEPVSGQAGKDVVWVPTSPALVDLMMKVARVTRDDFVMDLGSGDGRNIIAAAKLGANGLGVEFNPDMVALSRRRAAEAGVADKARFVEADMYEADISKATVLALFLLPVNMNRLAPKFLDLAPGSRIVANTFGIDGWDPDLRANVSPDAECESWCEALLWIVPAQSPGHLGRGPAARSCWNRPTRWSRAPSRPRMRRRKSRRAGCRAT